MSGVVNNCWAMTENNDHVELAYKIARDLGAPKDNIPDLIAFLKSAPARNITQYSTVRATDILFEVAFTPVMESKSQSYSNHYDNIGKIHEKFALFIQDAMPSSHLLWNHQRKSTKHQRST